MPPHSKISFVAPENDPFTIAVKARINAYFRASGKSRHWNGLMLAKTCFYIGGLLGCYLAILSGQFSEPVLLGLCVGMGLFTAGIGFNVGHDAIHGGYSSGRLLTRIMSHSFTMIGANVYNWNISHNIVHHTYTNIPGADGDLSTVPALRFSSEAPWKPFHRYQHLYAYILYALSTLMWVTKKDYRHFFEEKLLIYQKPSRPPRREYFILFGGKLVYYFMMLVIPALVLDLPVWKIITGFVVMHLAAGAALANVFAMGHMVEGTALRPAGPDGHIHESWAAHQVRTSANFGTRYPHLSNWFCGGLNFQIEHHLFPRICHVHYPDIAPIVKQTAAEFGIPYTEFETILAGARSHYRWLRHYGAGRRGVQPIPAAPTVP
ncbi:MAG: acyl-CoA desaturase [Deltaproteobacteria bacterium]|nr:acyl-CoA desaturase [Deltaproteobacteria bacterium]